MANQRVSKWGHQGIKMYINPMVLIWNGNSRNIFARVKWNWFWRHLFELKKLKNLFPKCPVLLHLCTSWSELPHDISNIVQENLLGMIQQKTRKNAWVAFLFVWKGLYSSIERGCSIDEKAFIPQCCLLTPDMLEFKSYPLGFKG